MLKSAKRLLFVSALERSSVVSRQVVEIRHVGSQGLPIGFGIWPSHMEQRESHREDRGEVPEDEDEQHADEAAGVDDRLMGVGHGVGPGGKPKASVPLSGSHR